MGECLFCDRHNQGLHRIVAEADRAWLRLDNYPAAEGHMQAVTKRHVERFADLDISELLDMHTLLLYAMRDLHPDRPDAYTIGVNDGAASGQSIPHLHVHLIPRRWGDVPDPRGGIRRAVEDAPFDVAAWEAAHTAPQRPQEPRSPQTHTRTTPAPTNPAAGTTGPHRRHT